MTSLTSPRRLPSAPRPLRVALAALAICALAPTAGARAQLQFTVNVEFDIGDELIGTVGDGVCGNPSTGACTLRAAVDELNGHPTASSAVVTFDSTGIPSGTLILGAQLAVVGGRMLTIVGPEGKITIDGNDNGRLFDVNAGAMLRLTDVRLIRGDAGAERGGGIRNAGDTRLLRVDLEDCTADDGGGSTTRAPWS